MKFHKTALIITVMLSLATAASGFTADKRIRFAKGRSSATVSGLVSNGGRNCYLIRGKKGQTLSASVTSKSGKAVIFESGETSFSDEIRITGDQSVCVDNLARATAYTLRVSIK